MNQRKQKDKDNKKLGIMGEDKACDYINKKGFRILQRNFRCSLGEIDIIASKDEYLIFIEVKTRKETINSLSPLLAVNFQKREKLRRLGEYYLSQNSILGKQPRFDVIGITLKSDSSFKFEHIENAF